MHSTSNRLSILFAALGLALYFACAVNPVSGKKELALMSEAQEMAIGLDGAAQVKSQFVVLDNHELQTYVSGVGQKLAAAQTHRPGLKFDFTVLDASMVNAFALPGGHIYMTRGILQMMNSEEEMAGVLGHEIGHVTARHAVSRMSQAQLMGALTTVGMVIAGPKASSQYGQYAQLGVHMALMGHSRKDELQSDSLGVQYTGLAGYNPAGAKNMLQMLDRLHPAQPDAMEKLFLSHPPPAVRVARVEQALAKVPEGQLQRPMHRDHYLQQIDGLVYGPSLAAGLVQDGIYHNGRHGLKMRLPSGWETSAENDGPLLTGNRTSKSAPAAFQLIAAAGEKADDATLNGFFQQIGAQVESRDTESLGGGAIRAQRINFRIDGQQPERLFFNGWFFEKDATLFMLLVYSPRSESLHGAGEIAAGISLLSPADSRKIKIEKMRVAKTASTGTVEALARKALPNEGAEGAEALLLLNGWQPGASIAAGTLYKVPPPSMLAQLRKSKLQPPAKPQPRNE